MWTGQAQNNYWFSTKEAAKPSNEGSLQNCASLSYSFLGIKKKKQHNKKDSADFDKMLKGVVNSGDLMESLHHGRVYTSGDTR